MLRASSHKTKFDKGYMPNWTKEHFTVSHAEPPRRGTKRRVYNLVDYNDKNVKSSWFKKKILENFIQPVSHLESLRQRTLPYSTQ